MNSSRLTLLNWTLLLAATLVAWAVPVLAGPSRWTGGLPEGASISGVAMFESSASEIFVSTLENGVFRSDDGGNTWSAAGNLVPERTVDIDIAGDGVLYAANFRDSIARGASDSDLWTLLSTGLPADPFFREIAVSPDDSTRVAVALFDHGVYWSDDSGNTFAASSGLPASATVQEIDLAPGGKLALAGISNSLASGSAIFRSDNLGETWSGTTGIPTEQLIRDLKISSVNTSNALAALSGTAKIYVSTTEGAQWALAANAGLTGSVSELTFSPDDGATALAASSDGVFLTTDLAATWTLLAPLEGFSLTGVAMGTSTRSSELRGPTSFSVVVGDTDGVSVSGDGGATFARSVSGLEARSCAARLLQSPDRPQSAHCGRFYTTDSGQTWEESSFTGGSAVPIYDGAIAASQPSRIFYNGESSLYRSDDRGMTWVSAITDASAFGGLGPLMTSTGVDPRDHQNVIVGNFSQGTGSGATGPGVLLSNDGGGTWNALYTPTLGVNEAFFSLTSIVDLDDSDILFVAGWTRVSGGSSTAFVLKSDDQGASWNTALSVPTAIAFDLVQAPSDPKILYVRVRLETGDGKYYRSGNQGTSFAEVTDTYPCWGPIALSPSDESRIFLGCDVVHESLDGGASWTAFDATGFSSDIEDIDKITVSENPLRLFAATNAGVYEYVEAIFLDGFEAGDTSAWTEAVP